MKRTLIAIFIAMTVVSSARAEFAALKAAAAGVEKGVEQPMMAIANYRLGSPLKVIVSVEVESTGWIQNFSTDTMSKFLKMDIEKQMVAKGRPKNIRIKEIEGGFIPSGFCELKVLAKSVSGQGWSGSDSSQGYSYSDSNRGYSNYGSSSEGSRTQESMMSIQATLLQYEVYTVGNKTTVVKEPVATLEHQVSIKNSEIIAMRERYESSSSAQTNKGSWLNKNPYSSRSSSSSGSEWRKDEDIAAEQQIDAQTSRASAEVVSAILSGILRWQQMDNPSNVVIVNPATVMATPPQKNASCASAGSCK